jgi:hypothetical protein
VQGWSNDGITTVHLNHKVRKYAGKRSKKEEKTLLE